jgi:uncharacterized protein YqgC (DUF456 family)
MEKAKTKNSTIFGVLIIILGFIGLVVPVMPGWVLILAGLALL